MLGFVFSSSTLCRASPAANAEKSSWWLLSPVLQQLAPSHLCPGDPCPSGAEQQRKAGRAGSWLLVAPLGAVPSVPAPQCQTRSAVLEGTRHPDTAAQGNVPWEQCSPAASCCSTRLQGHNGGCVHGAEPWSGGFSVVPDLAGLTFGQRKEETSRGLCPSQTLHPSQSNSRVLTKGMEEKKKKTGCAAVRVLKLCLPPCIPALGCGDVNTQVLCCLCPWRHR